MERQRGRERKRGRDGEGEREKMGEMKIQCVSVGNSNDKPLAYAVPVSRLKRLLIIDNY